MSDEQKLNYCFIAYAILIVLVAVIPIGSSEQLDKTFIFHFRADYLLHSAVFIPWAFFCVKTNKRLPLWLFAGMLYGVASEVVQYWIPYRSFNINDMLANLIGVAAGFVIFVPLLRSSASDEI